MDLCENPTNRPPVDPREEEGMHHRSKHQEGGGHLLHVAVPPAVPGGGLLHLPLRRASPAHQAVRPAGEEQGEGRGRALGRGLRGMDLHRENTMSGIIDQIIALCRQRTKNDASVKNIFWHGQSST